MTIKAYPYQRWSHSTQADGMSLERQQDAVDQWIRAHPSITLDSSFAFVDDGVSASRGKNLAVGALSRFREAVSAGDVVAGSYFLVESVSRFSRLLPMDSQPVLRELVEAGIRVIFLDGPTEYNLENLGDLGADVVFRVKAHEAAGYAKTLGVYRAKAWVKAREDMRAGKPSTRIIPWWFTCAATFVDGKVGRGAIEKHPVYAPIVERIFKEYVGGRGVNLIAQGLERDGIPCPKHINGEIAEHWRHSAVLRVLASRSTIGELQPMKEVRTPITIKSGILKALKRQRTNDGAPIPNYYPRIVSDELFEQARQIRASNKMRAGSRITIGRCPPKHILSQLATCPICNGAMKRSYKGDARYPAKYICSRAVSAKAGSCAKVYISVEAVTKAFCDGAAALERGAPGADASLNADRSRLEAELAAESAKLAKVSDAIFEAVFVNGETVSTAERAAQVALEAHVGAITSELNACNAKSAAASTNVIKQRLARMNLALGDYELLGEAHVVATAAALYECFSRIVIDYQAGLLICHWRHGPPPSVLPCKAIKVGAS